MTVLIALARILAGFLVACLAAAAVLVVFGLAPQIAGVEGVARTERLWHAVSLVLPFAVTMAIFASPLFLVVAAFAEWQALRGPVFYSLAFVGIAGAGFLTQYWGEAQGQPTILNSYAVSALLVPGLVAGLVYWAIAGRLAGRNLGVAADELERGSEGDSGVKALEALVPGRPWRAAGPGVGIRPKLPPAEPVVQSTPLKPLRDAKAVHTAIILDKRDVPVKPVLQPNLQPNLQRDSGKPKIE